MGPAGTEGALACRLAVLLGSLVGLLIVLVTLVFVGGGPKVRNPDLMRARAELHQITTAIESYKSALGRYPPDNQENHLVNQLYYELVGTSFSSGGSGAPNTNVFLTSGGDVISVVDFAKALGRTNTLGQVNRRHPVGHVYNFAGTVGPDRRWPVTNFLRGVSSSGGCQTDPATGLRVLVCSFKWPPGVVVPPLSGFVSNYCAWRYNSSSPVKNPRSYDLWADLLIDGKTNRLCNWSSELVPAAGPDE